MSKFEVLLAVRFECEGENFIDGVMFASDVMNDMESYVHNMWPQSVFKLETEVMDVCRVVIGDKNDEDDN